MKLLADIAATQKGPKLRPQTALQALSDLAPDDAMYSMDCGANTHFAARMIQIREGQSFTGSGTLVRMGSAPPLAELSTAVFHRLNVKVMVLNNDSLAEVKFEQKEIGAQHYFCALGHIDFAAFAQSVGAS